MKVLLGTCVWKGALEMIRAASHDANWVGDWNKVPGDEAILRQANSESRIFVTIGKDFGELAVLRGLPHHGILRIYFQRDSMVISVWLPWLLMAKCCYQELSSRQSLVG